MAEVRLPKRPRLKGAKTAASAKGEKGAKGDSSRRRFLRRRWGRRWLTLRYVLVGLLVVALAALAVYAVYFSSWLRAEGVQVGASGRQSQKRQRAIGMMLPQAVQGAAAAGDLPRKSRVRHAALADPVGT